MALDLLFCFFGMYLKRDGMVWRCEIGSSRALYGKSRIKSTRDVEVSGEENHMSKINYQAIFDL